MLFLPPTLGTFYNDGTLITRIEKPTAGLVLVIEYSGALAVTRQGLRSLFKNDGKDLIIDAKLQTPTKSNIALFNQIPLHIVAD